MTSNKYRRGRHSVTLLHAHLVFIVKYRKKVFSKEHIDEMAGICQDIAVKMDFQVLEVNGEEDYIHLLIEYPPKLSISQIVNALKGVSSRLLRKKFNLIPHQDHLWSPSYFAISCGGAPINKIREYIENQEKPDF